MREMFYLGMSSVSDIIELDGGCRMYEQGAMME